MSKIAFTPNANGSGVFTLASPNSNTNRTITLPDESVTLGAGTPSIDDNGNATALTIDSSENVLVGKTSSSFSTEGSQLNSNGSVDITKSGGAALFVNRLSSDGDIAKFYKDGTAVGNIASGDSGNEFKWYGTFSSGAGLGAYSNVSIRPLSNTGAAADGTVNLGHSSQRFKDAYLSGGIYLGGTGAANKLDDYEYGSWTPTSDNAGSVTPNNAVYTKIGDQVTVWCLLTDFTDRSTATSLTVKGLPFNSTNGGVAVGSCMCQYVANTAHTIYMTGSSGLQFYKSENGSGFVVLNHSDLQNSAAQVYLMATYTAA